MALGGVDEIVAIANLYASSVTADGRVEMESSGGGTRSGLLHPDWKAGLSLRLKGRTVDLKSAYKQLVRARADSMISIIAVFDPSTGGPSFL